MDSCKWVFKRKYDAEGQMEQYKSQLVAEGFFQKQGVDYDEIFCLIVRFESVRTIIALPAKHDLKLHRLEITTAFLNGQFKEAIYMKQPEGFEIKVKDDLVCKVKRSIYGLKQSSRCWSEAIDSKLKRMHFKQLENDPCIYTPTAIPIDTGARLTKSTDESKLFNQEL